jgi:hypothetical protein
MIVIPAGVQVHLALGYTDMRKGTRRTCDSHPGTSEEGSVLGSSVRLPRQECIALEDPVLEWDRAVSLHQADRPCEVVTPDEAREIDRLYNQLLAAHPANIYRSRGGNRS